MGSPSRQPKRDYPSPTRDPQPAPGRSPPVARIVLSGYYGFGNLGDEAILAASVTQLRQRLPDAEIVVLSGAPGRTAREHAVRAIHRWNPLEIVQVLRQSTLFLSGGGSLLQDITSSRSLVYYAGLLLLAQRLHVPTMIFAQGIGPIEGALNRRLMRLAMQQVQAVSVRDWDSRQELLDLGCDGDRIAVTADLALALDPAPAERAIALLDGAGLDPSKPIIGIAVRPWPAWCERQLKCFSAVLAQQAHAWDAQLLVLPFQLGQDLAFCQELTACLALRPPPHLAATVLWTQAVSPADMMAVIGRLDLLLGMRLHALILAARMEVPALGIVYDPKVMSFAQQVGFDYFPSVTALQDTEQLSTVLKKAWQGRGAARTQLARRIGPLRRLAQQNVELAAELVAANARAPTMERRLR